MTKKEIPDWVRKKAYILYPDIFFDDGGEKTKGRENRRKRRAFLEAWDLFSETLRTDPEKLGLGEVREAVRFYGDRENYPVGYHGNNRQLIMNHKSCDYGKRARKALKSAGWKDLE